MNLTQLKDILKGQEVASQPDDRIQILIQCGDTFYEIRASQVYMRAGSPIPIITLIPEEVDAPFEVSSKPRLRLV